MSSYSHPRLRSFKANGDMSAHQYSFVKLVTDNATVDFAGAGDHCIGILMNAPKAAGERAEVALPGGGALLKLGTGGTNLMEFLKPTTNGVGIKGSADNDMCYALAMDSGVSGDIIAVEVVTMLIGAGEA